MLVLRGPHNDRFEAQYVNILGTFIEEHKCEDLKEDLLQVSQYFIQKTRKSNPLIVLSRYHDGSAGSSMPILQTMHRPDVHLAEGLPLEALARHRHSSTCWIRMNRPDRKAKALFPASLLARSGFHPAKRRLTTPMIDLASCLS